MNAVAAGRAAPLNRFVAGTFAVPAAITADFADGP